MITCLNNLISINAELPDSLANNLSNFQRGVMLAAKYDDYRNLVAMHGNMARAYDAASKPDLALTFYQIDLDYFDKADNNEVKAGFLSYYGKHLFRNGQSC